MQTIEAKQFIFDIPYDKSEVIKAFEGLMATFRIENKADMKKATCSPKNKKLDKFERLDKFIGIINGSITDEEVKQSRIKKYVK